MRVEISIAQGDPQSPGGWNVSQPVFMVVFPFEARWRIGWLFGLISQLDFGQDDILVLSVDAELTAALVERVRELRDRRLHHKICLLDGGRKLTDMTAAQIRARVG